MHVVHVVHVVHGQQCNRPMLTLATFHILTARHNESGSACTHSSCGVVVDTALLNTHALNTHALNNHACMHASESHFLP